MGLSAMGIMVSPFVDTLHGWKAATYCCLVSLGTCALGMAIVTFATEA